MIPFERRSDALKEFGIREIIALTGVVISILAQFVVPVIPEKFQASFRYAFLLVFILTMCYGLAAFFVRQGQRGKPAQLTVDPSRQLVFQLWTPVVVLRMATVHEVMDGLTARLPEAERQSSLYKIGTRVGTSWADVLEQIYYHDRRQTYHDLNDLFRVWSEFDAESGVGIFQVAVSPDGNGDVYLKNSYVTQKDASCGVDLDWYTAGYVAGTLSKLLSKPVDAVIVNSNSKRHTDAHFKITPRTGPA